MTKSEERNLSPAAEGAAPRLGLGTRIRPFSKSLPMALLRGREAVMRHFRPTLRHFGITEQQWRVLRALSAVDHAEVMALASATEILPPSLSRLLRDLDARGLVQRQNSPEDMRRVLISLSPTGEALLARVGVFSEEIYTALSERVGAERLQQLLQLLRALEEELNKGAPIGETIDLGLDAEPAPMRRGRPRLAR